MGLAAIKDKERVHEDKGGASLGLEGMMLGVVVLAVLVLDYSVTVSAKLTTFSLYPESEELVYF